MSAEQQIGPEADLKARIEAIESGYEFLLAYAAQGRSTDRGGGAGQEVREFLGNMEQALTGLGDVVRARAGQRGAALVAACGAFFDALEDDSRKARGAIRLVLAQNDISSQLVDNLNGNIHVRATLMDLFVVDEALKGGDSNGS